MLSAKYQPPPVAWTVNPPLHSGGAPWFIGLGLVSILAWAIGTPKGFLPSLSAGVLMFLALLVGHRELRSVPIRVLAWNQREWTATWRSDNQDTEFNGVFPCTVRVLMDFQVIILARIRLQNGRTHVVWLSRKSDPQQWHRLRCALFSARQP